MPKMSSRHRTQALAWSPGAAGPALDGRAPTYRAPVAPAAASSATQQHKSRAQIRDDVITAMIRNVPVGRIAHSMGLSRGDVTEIGRKAGRELDTPTDRMVPRGHASNPGATLIPLLAPRDDERGWKDRALCPQTDPDAFFPEKGGATTVNAKKVCRNCTVRAECLEYALDHHENFGIWGGLSERERHRIIRERAAAAQEAA